MARPRALLLDFYGTLVHEDTTVIQAICREVSRNAPAASPGEVARTWSSAFTALTAASHGTGFRPQRELARMSLTGTVRYYLDAALAHHELAGYFTHLVTSQDARAYKPRPEMFTTALGLLGLGPHEVIHVGDSLTSDVAGAARLGMPVAWVNRQRRPAPEAGPKPTYEVADLGELLVLLDG